MSLMSYTFTAEALGGELTLIITMPEKNDMEHLPFATAVLVPDTTMESNHFMRKEPLERYGCGQPSMATVSLPGRVALYPPSVLLDFLVDGLPSVLQQFPLRLCALYAEGDSAARLLGMEEALKRRYPSLKLNTMHESFGSFMDGLKKALLFAAS